jgi:hypothetical protein
MAGLGTATLQRIAIRGGVSRGGEPASPRELLD